ncbi:MAG: hypothetical protein ACTHLY_13995 [Pseudolabrys sp.]
MKRATILATAVSLFGSLGANAEPLRAVAAPGGAMPAFEAVTITRSIGLDPLGGPVWRNGRYVLLATDHGGREMRVVLDAYDGAVLAVRPLARRYFEPGEPGPGYGPRDYVVREEYDTVEPVVPPLPRATHAAPLQRGAALTPPALEPHKPVQKKPVVKPAQSAKAAVPSPTAKPDTTMKSDAAKTEMSVKKSADKPQTDKSAKSSSTQQAQTTGKASGEHKEIRKIELYKTPEDNAAAPAPADTAKPSDSKPEDNGAPTTPINPLL